MLHSKRLHNTCPTFPLYLSTTSMDEAPESKDITWSIADVERDTGLGKDTLRVWERRYGFPQPGRDAHGEREYDHAQLLRLRLIKRLIDAGHRPGKVVALPHAQLEQLCERVASAPQPTRQVRTSMACIQLDSPWLDWLKNDQTELLRNGLQQQVMRQGLANAVEQLVAPLCYAVGESWMRGELSVYQEHLFTEAVQSVLRDAIATAEAGGRPLQRKPKVLLTTTPAEQHVLGLLMAECFFALEACERISLGPSTPIPDIVVAARQLDVDIVALSFSSHATRREVSDSLQQLIDQLPEGIEVWAGGAAVAAYRKGLPEAACALTRASDVSTQVASWRSRHGH